MAKKNAQLKTQPTKQTIAQFIKTLEDPLTRADCTTLTKMMQAATKEKGQMWGSSIAGFGRAHLRYASGRELDWFSVGFSPRKNSLVLYLLLGYKNKAALLKKLGKHKIGKSCLYIKHLSDVDLSVLKVLIEQTVQETKKKYIENKK